VEQNNKIYVAGHKGLVGSSIIRKLSQLGFSNIIIRTRAELDLTNREAVAKFMKEERPEYVFLAAAKVGGILANSTYPVQFLETNLEIQTNVMRESARSGVRKLMFLGSSCIYPKECLQPIREEYLLSGPLEPTNEWYAVSKIAGIKLAQAYRQQYGFNAICAMPTNLYGPNDNFDLDNAHVLPAMLKRFYEGARTGAENVMLWGTGKPRREFMYVDDLADALVFLMQNYNQGEIINVGTGSDITILELAERIAKVTGFSGSICFDHDKPDGTLEKRLDVSRLSNLGWSYKTTLEKGIKKTYEWYMSYYN